MKLNDILINKKAEVLDDEKKKLIKGHGCGYSNPWTDSIVRCVSSAAEAEMAAGENGWWCCGCAEASHC